MRFVDFEEFAAHIGVIHEFPCTVRSCERSYTHEFYLKVQVHLVVHFVHFDYSPPLINFSSANIDAAGGMVNFSLPISVCLSFSSQLTITNQAFKVGRACIGVSVKISRLGLPDQIFQNPF